jgi:glutamate-1-semialdehyde 2,1-aminomutase
MRIIAILQARVSSQRLPGKVLKPILGISMLQHQIERISRACRIDQLVVATSTDISDNGIEDLCKNIQVPIFRGHLDDVLDRFYQAAMLYHPEHIVRLTGDCPLIDPEIIDQVIDYYLQGDYDFASNAIEPTFPDGLDVEVFRFRALVDAWKNAKMPFQREHVTSYIYNKPNCFKIGLYKNREKNLSCLRWTVDEPQDFEFVTRVYEQLYPTNPAFSTVDILKLLDNNPQLNEINHQFKRNEGLQKSLEADQKILNSKKLNILKSHAMQERAKKRIPGLSQLLSKRPDLFSYGVWPGYFSKAKGAEVWDLDGNRYIDMSIGGIGANVLGYADPDVDGAVKAAIENGTSSSLNCPEEVELADLLCELHPWADKVRYARTGGESMAIAVRIARTFTGRDKVVFCGYHGWHDWYLAANVGTANALGEHLISGLEPAGVPKGLAGTAIPFQYNQLDKLEKILSAHRNQIAAIIMEPIRNEQPLPGFLEGVKELAGSFQSVLIMDEISSGFRMNTGGAHMQLNIEPDIAVFSKALGNGYPIAAIIGIADVMEAAQRTFISSTYWTERIGPTAAVATIRKHRHNNVGDHLMRIGKQVQAGWHRFSDKHNIPIHIEGIPPLSHFSFKDEKSLV